MSKKHFRWHFAKSLTESPVSLTDKAAIPACNLFSTEYNQQNKHKIILLVADCCVGTWTAPNVPAAALFCFVCLFVSCCINGFYITFIIQWKHKKDHSGCMDAKMVLWRNLAAYIHFWNWWSLYIFTWLHLYKICGLLSALSGHEGSTLGVVGVPVHYTLHHFTAGTLPNCCHHPKQSFYASLNFIFLSPRKTDFKHVKVLCGKMKERGKFEIFICISISDNFFWFASTLLMGCLRYIIIFHSWTVKVVW